MQMNRRAFLGGAFGLVALVTGASVVGASQNGSEGAAGAYFLTSSVVSPDEAAGPAMQAGISLVKDGETTRGMVDDTHLFDVDSIGAELIERADGTLTIDQLAEATSVPVNAADVASFFVSLGQAGYLQNEVYVNLTQTIA